MVGARPRLTGDGATVHACFGDCRSAWREVRNRHGARGRVGPSAAARAREMTPIHLSLAPSTTLARRVFRSLKSLEITGRSGAWFDLPSHRNVAVFPNRQGDTQC